MASIWESERREREVTALERQGTGLLRLAAAAERVAAALEAISVGGTGEDSDG
jgi:hypothetical protein